MIVVLILILVAIVAIVVDEIRRGRKAETEVRAKRPDVPVEQPIVIPAPPAVPSTSPTQVEQRRPARKPRATKQTVLEELKRSGPSTARELSTKFTGASPTIVAGLLVSLRGDHKVTSERRRNLQIWSAS